MLNSPTIAGCHFVPVSANRDSRGCLFEIFRQNWQGAFPAVQWNACVSEQGVLRGVHVHFDYAEYYTLPRGSVTLGLVDIRANSPTFRVAQQIQWRDSDGFAVVVPEGVAHVVHFEETSVLAFGLSGYWKAENDVLGCRWDDPDLGLDLRLTSPRLSERDAESGSFARMVECYNAMGGRAG